MVVAMLMRIPLAPTHFDTRYIDRDWAADELLSRNRVLLCRTIYPLAFGVEEE